MKKSNFTILFALIVLPFFALAQCPTDVTNGQNLIVNGDFSNDYTGWSYDNGYTEFTPCGSACYSVPGKIYAGDDPQDFNAAFSTISDHTPGTDNMMLMVDGICSLGEKLWTQSGIPVVPNTNYYFSVWITSLYLNTPRGSLIFDINGANQITNITPTGAVGNWTSYTVVWNSGPTPPPTITISLENTTTTGCNNAVDFAIDDISFSPGCEFGVGGPQPDLGPDRTLCGTGGSITLDANVPVNATTTVTWNDGLTGTGIGAPYTRVVSSPGTYSVCVSDGGSCVKSDFVEITNSFSLNLPDNITLCDPADVLLDAGYTGPGVTYEWFQGHPNPALGTNDQQTYSANAPGIFSVNVTDPGCGTVSDSVTVSTLAASPNNQIFCPPASANLSVSGGGAYKWFDAPTGGTELAVGSNFTTPTLISSTTYYVEDTSTFEVEAGPPVSGHGFDNAYGNSPTSSNDDGLLIFNALTDFRLDSISVYPINYYCPTPHPNSGVLNDINIEIRDASGNHIPGSPVNVQLPCRGTNNPGSFNPAVLEVVPIEIDIPQGNGYQMKLASGSDNIIGYLNGTGPGGTPPSPRRYSYPTSYAGVVEFAANSSAAFNLYYNPDAFPGYFDWKITKGINCARVPVMAVEDCPLEINFIEFNAEKISKKDVALNWEAQIDENFERFEVLRSFDAEVWKSIGSVSAMNYENNFDYYDYGIQNKEVYYKIKGIEKDGSEYFSEIRHIVFDLEDIRFYPNPVKTSNDLNIASTSEMTIFIMDQAGKAVTTATLRSNSQTFKAPETPGMYIIRAENDSGYRKSFKLIVEP